ncbi:Protein N-acetyltransferase, RimJ/RimL family [Clostridium collagenovorans DSM 3089]|uniref:Protein N-acetyltransferase, RimJ/RimL family n=1 Tax=Clostridium collagenovorans DSM 3089 TaxID=1121306 RepID=A0A1M5VEP9_9CLOT|nr:GNAT family protein [Clostridium collagenovorans]SHH73710.1 Protein N-acetyltransferase, RimJ/RimL family [Clostridium collagenovorans DSM 3089]
MYLKEGELLIRNAKLEDADILCSWWNDGKVMEHAGFPNGIHISREDIIENIAKDFHKRVRLIIEVKSKAIGEMSYLIEDNIADIGIKICEFSYQEKGYGSKSLKLLLNYLFSEVKVLKVILDTNLNNKRAQHVYEKIGFKKVDIKIDSWKDEVGNLQSVVYYELKKEDYK